MREIKFRAWEKTLKEIIPVYSIDFKNKQININGAWRFFDEVELMEYTGLKDKNNKEIYEGDIVRCWGGEYCQGYWEFDETIIIKDLTHDCFMMGERGNIQVWGNIYDNLELLKEAK